MAKQNDTTWEVRLTPLYFFILVQTILWSVISICLFWAEPSGRMAHKYGARPWARILLWGSRVKVSLHGVENFIRPTGPMVVVSNHQSMYDILALLAVLPVDYKFIVKKELRSVPLWGYAMEKAGYIFIDRADTGGALDMIRAAAQKIRSGDSVLFFAEGTRSEGAQPAPFKRGAFVLASKSGCDVVPLVIEGTSRVLPNKSLKIRPGRVSITVLPPVTDPALKKNSKRLMVEVRNRMLDHLESVKDAAHGN